MSAQFWLGLDSFLMLLGGIGILFVGRQRTEAEQAHTLYHGIVPIIAACAYFAMAVGQGSVLLHTGHGGRVFYFARYIDWSFTTPLLLLPLAYTAVHSNRRRVDLIAGMLLADLMMIVTAFAFGASEVAVVKWSWFVISCVAFLAVLWVMWVPLRAQNRLETARVQASYTRDAGILTVLWSLYPLILFVDPDGTGLVGGTTGVALIAIVDLLSKPVYGWLSMSAMTKIIDDEVPGAAQAIAARRVA